MIVFTLSTGGKEMKVILKSNVHNIGRQGEIKEVSAGFARNYLLPRSIVMEANNINLKIWERERGRLKKHREEMINSAKEIAFKMETSKFVAKVKMSEDGKVFGSITTANLAKIFEDNGFKVNKRDILLLDNIKEIGNREINVRLHPEVVAKIKLSVINEKE
jgi:large subunit ribosomal protein L9